MQISLEKVETALPVTYNRRAYKGGYAFRRKRWGSGRRHNKRVVRQNKPRTNLHIILH